MAQEKNFYFSVGYHAPAFPQEISAHNETFGTTNKINTSYGQGINLLTGIDNPISNIFSWQLELRYLHGSKHTNHFTNDRAYWGENRDPNESHANVVSLSPLLAFHFLDKFYIKSGPIVGLTKVHYTVKYFNDKTHSKSDTPLSPVFGFQGSFGAIFYQSSKASFFSELNLIGMSFKPKKLKVEETTSFGSFGVIYEDDLQNRVLNDEGYRYTRQPSIKLPFSSVGIQVGVRFSL